MKGGNDAVNELDNDCVVPCSIPWISCAPTTSILTPRGLKGHHGRSGSLRPPPPPLPQFLTALYAAHVTF